MTIVDKSFDPSLRGYAMVAHECVKKALLDVVPNKNDPNKRRRNIEFAKYSPIISHFSDAYGYDEEKIRLAIIRNNQT